MTKKIPEDAFAFYVSLREDRSYQAVADRYGVSKRAIVDAAARENWMTRLAEIEEVAREKVDEKLAEDTAEMNLRHRKLLRAMASRAAKALSDYPLMSGMEGIRAAEATIKLERLLAGEPNERSTVTIEKVTKHEIDRLLARPDEVESGDDW